MITLNTLSTRCISVGECTGVSVASTDIAADTVVATGGPHAPLARRRTACTPWTAEPAIAGEVSDTHTPRGAKVTSSSSSALMKASSQRNHLPLSHTAGLSRHPSSGAACWPVAHPRDIVPRIHGADVLHHREQVVQRCTPPPLST